MPLSPASAVLLLQFAAAQAPAPLTQSPAQAVAVRATLSPVIDGKDDDPVWPSAMWVTNLRQYAPSEDTPPSMRTRATFAYDVALVS